MIAPSDPDARPLKAFQRAAPGADWRIVILPGAPSDAHYWGGAMEMIDPALDVIDDCTCECIGLVADTSLSGARVTREPDAITSQSWKSLFGVEISEPFCNGHAREFDFWLGEWRAEWRRRQQAHLFHEEQGVWARHVVFPVLDGKAVIELVTPESDKARMRGFSIRYFDVESSQWVMAQNWPNSPEANTAFLDQLRGVSRLGRIEMFSASDGDSPVQHLRRYTFSDVNENNFRWDSAQTDDGGDSWNTSMIAEFHRDLDRFQWPDGFAPLPTNENLGLCPDEASRRFDFLSGVWGSDTAHAGFTQVLNGCGVIGVITENGVASNKKFMAMALHPELEKWVIFLLDNSEKSRHQYFVETEAPSSPGAWQFIESPSLALTDLSRFIDIANVKLDEVGAAIQIQRLGENKTSFVFETARGRNVSGDYKSVITMARE